MSILTYRRAEEARRFVQTVAAGQREAAAMGEVARELARNAVLHTASGRTGGYFAVKVGIRTRRSRVQVMDLGGTNEPTLATIVNVDEDGRVVWACW